MKLFNFLDDNVEAGNEETISKNLRQMKEDRTSFKIMMKNNKKISLDTNLRCKLLPLVRITYHAVSILEGEGSDGVLGQTIIEIDDTNINICFKLVGQEMEDIVKIEQSFREIFGEHQEPKLLLNEAQAKDEETALILPAMIKSYNYLSMKLSCSEFVEKLNGSGPHWLSLVFNGLDVDEQKKLFSRENKEVKKLLRHINESDMIKEREDLITMMIDLDKQENEDPENGPSRVIERLKISLETSDKLTEWFDSVDAKYPMPKSRMWKETIIGFITLVMGLGMFLTDVGTDGSFTDTMRGFQREAMVNGTESNSSKRYYQSLDDITYSCSDISPLDCLVKLEEALAAWHGNFDKEVNRFEDPKMWGMMFIVSIIHMIIPCVFSLLCGAVLLRRTKKWWTIVEFIPIIAKVKTYYYSLQLNQKKMMPKSTKSDEEIKMLNKKTAELEESATLVNIHILSY